MRVEVKLPKLSDTMTEAALVTWLKAEGDAVDAGESIAEIETDKSTVDLEAPQSGVLIEIVVPAGTDSVPVGMLLAVIETEGDAAGDASGDAAASEADEAGTSDTAPSEQAPPDSGDETTASKQPPTEKAPATTTKGDEGDEAKAAAPAPAAQDSSKIPATPVARRMARQAGLDIGSIQGTGPGGKIYKADVESAVSGSGASSAAQSGAAVASSGATSASPTTSSPGASPYRDEPLSRVRRTIAQRLTESKQQVPHFYLRAECEVTALLETRAALNDGAEDYKLSVNDFVVRAAAVALRQVPEANASWQGDALRFYEHADIAVAVATDGGLVTPIVTAADTLGLREISLTTADLAARAREGRLKPEEYQGGTFTVSNLGMYGIESLYAIINPPQACILGVGTAEQRPVVRDGELAVGTVMTCTLSADHRVVDGAVGARFMAALKSLLEDPRRMLL